MQLPCPEAPVTSFYVHLLRCCISAELVFIFVSFTWSIFFQSPEDWSLLALGSVLFFSALVLALPPRGAPGYGVLRLPLCSVSTSP